jgi:hypothetical protein
MGILEVMLRISTIKIRDGQEERKEGEKRGSGDGERGTEKLIAESRASNPDNIVINLPACHC